MRNGGVETRGAAVKIWSYAYSAQDGGLVYI